MGVLFQIRDDYMNLQSDEVSLLLLSSVSRGVQL